VPSGGSVPLPGGSDRASLVCANKRRLGKQLGAKVAQIDIARRLTEAIWQCSSASSRSPQLPKAPLFVARHVGASVAMLDPHYAGVIANWDGERVPADEQIRRARAGAAPPCSAENDGRGCTAVGPWTPGRRWQTARGPSGDSKS